MYPTEHSARIIAPKKFVKGSLRSRKVADGIRCIFGIDKASGETADQAYRFDVKHFTINAAEDWLAAHSITPAAISEATGERGNKMNVEVRYNKAHGTTVETRTDGEDKVEVITGYAARFYDGTPETEYELMDGVYERIERSAFNSAIGRDDVRGLFNHDPNMLLGRTGSGTVKLSVDKKGLRYEITAGNTSVHQNVQEHIERGDLYGSSFAFRATGVRWEDDGEREIRNITDVSLFDVGPVTYPAYEGTSTDMRSDEPWSQEVDAWRESKNVETREENGEENKESKQEEETNSSSSMLQIRKRRLGLLMRELGVSESDLNTKE